MHALAELTERSTCISVANCMKLHQTITLRCEHMCLYHPVCRTVYNDSLPIMIRLQGSGVTQQLVIVQLDFRCTVQSWQWTCVRQVQRD